MAIKDIINKKTLTDSTKKEIIKTYFHFVLDSNSKAVDAIHGGYETILQLCETSGQTPIQMIDNVLDYHEEKNFENVLKAHKEKNFKAVKNIAKCIYSLHDIELDDDCFDGSFLFELSLANVEAHRIVKARSEGETPTIPDQYRETEVTVPPTQHRTTSPEPTTSVIAQSLSEIPLTQVISEYSKDRESIEKWSDKSKRENLACYENFIDFAGSEICCSEINYHLVSDYRAALLKLPANRKKVKKYRTKTFAELIEMNVDNPISITTVNKNLNRLSSLLKFAVKLNYMPNNPAENMEIPIDKKDSELREIFNPNDLKKLFHSEQYLSDTFKKPFMFWTCPIALFTGMRQTEIAQLYLDDIYVKDDFWVIDINNRADKKIKTKNARRIIPMHPFLVDQLRLPDYVEHLKTQDHKRLFPEISYGRDGYGQRVSRWFNGKRGYKLGCGIEMPLNGAKKDFHSFRHTLIDHLKQKQVNLPLLHEFDGHSHGTMTMDRYGKAYNIKTVYDEVVCEITFDKELGLDYLAGSKYVVDFRLFKDHLDTKDPRVK